MDGRLRLLFDRAGFKDDLDSGRLKECLIFSFHMGESW